MLFLKSPCTHLIHIASWASAYAIHQQETSRGRFSLQEIEITITDTLRSELEAADDSQRPGKFRCEERRPPPDEEAIRRRDQRLVSRGPQNLEPAIESISTFLCERDDAYRSSNPRETIDQDAFCKQDSSQMSLSKLPDCSFLENTRSTISAMKEYLREQN